MNTSISKTKNLEEKLAKLKRQEEENDAKRLAKKFNLPYIDLAIKPIDTKDLAILPEQRAKKGNLLVIKKIGQVLYIALRNPDDPETKQIIKELLEQNFECRLFIVSLTSLEKGWQRYRELTTLLDRDASLKDAFTIQKKELEEFKESLQTIQELKKAISEMLTTKLVTIVMAGAIKMKASDIHLEPEKEEIRLRYRIDGLLQDVATFPIEKYHFFLSRIKTLTNMFLNVHDISQDGRFTVKITENQKTTNSIDIRVSVLPSSYGESIVMRLLGTSAVKLNLEDLGIRPELFKIIKTQISQPNGMILNTGPTGAGKTTTLYACLSYVNKPGIKIITIEDPVEYKLKGITQTQINKEKGYTFAKSLRAIVRQDPDILMVGEIRDQESAEIAVQFALTGHIVLSTLHTNNAAGAIPRLTKMNAEPSSLSSSLNLIIAQRLLRKLCPHCKKTHQPAQETMEATKKILSLISPKAGLKIPKQTLTFYTAQGCPKCYGLGYQGRIGIYEFLTISKEVDRLILNKAAASEIQAKAIEEGMIIMMQDGILRAIEGITSLEEVERIIGSIQAMVQEL